LVEDLSTTVRETEENGKVWNTSITLIAKLT
jgi:hypothetical protein